MKRVAQLAFCCLLVQGAFAQRGGGMHGGGRSGGGGGFRGGGGSGFHGGGGGGFRGGSGFRGSGFGGGFRGNGFRSGNRFFFGLGLGGFPYSYPYYGGGYGYYGGYPYYGYSAPAYFDQPAPVIMYQNPIYEPEPAPRPVIRDYAEGPPPPSSHEEAVYLIAFNDSSIRAALAYWVDGNTLRYVTTRHEQKEVPLESIDRALSLRLNRERRVDFRLP